MGLHVGYVTKIKPAGAEVIGNSFPQILEAQILYFVP